MPLPPAVASAFARPPPSAAADASSDGSAAGAPYPSGAGFRRTMTAWTLSPARRRAGRALAARASLPGASAASAASPASPRPGSAPQAAAPPFGRPPRPRVVVVPAAAAPPSPPLVRQSSAPDPALADEAAARLRQVFRQRAALADARRGGTTRPPGRVGRSVVAGGPATPRARMMDDSPSRVHGRGGAASRKGDDGDGDAAAPARRQALLVAGAAACAAAAHWRAVRAALLVLAPTPLAAALMLAAAALLAASGVFNSVVAVADRAARAVRAGARAAERLCGVVDALGLLPILLARLEAELGAVGTDIRSIRRKADWLPSRPRAARE